MPNIRIKDIPTTASATSSTDFIGIDGSANGTRKLNAYSPTFGGNLTVSGTGNSSVAGKLAINGGDLSASQFAIAAPSGSLAATLTAGATTNQSFGLRIFAGTSASDYALKIRNVGDTSTLLNVDGVGATTIGGNLTVSGGTVTSGSGTLTLNSSANTVVLQSAGTTALTLDSSQNATFAGDIRFSAGNSFDIGATGTRVRTAFIKTLVTTSGAPASASATGTAGTMTWDADYIYVCTATNTWKRVAIATW